MRYFNNEAAKAISVVRGTGNAAQGKVITAHLFGKQRAQAVSGSNQTR
jgi:hypothetical protein